MSTQVHNSVVRHHHVCIPSIPRVQNEVCIFVRRGHIVGFWTTKLTLYQDDQCTPKNQRKLCLML